MERRIFSSTFYYSVIFCFLIIGCAGPVLKMPEAPPPIVKKYKHVSSDFRNMTNTNIYLEEGDFFSILSTYSGAMKFRIGKSTPVLNQSYPINAYGSGYLHIGFWASSEKMPLNIGVDIIVWAKEDYVEIIKFFERMKEKDHKNKAINYALDEALRLKKVFLASKEASEKIADTLKKIHELKEDAGGEKEDILEKDQKGKPSPPFIPSKIDVAQQNKGAQLEERLTKQMEMLAKLEDLKNQLEREKEKSNLLVKKLEEKTKQEKMQLSKMVERSREQSHEKPVFAIPFLESFHALIIGNNNYVSLPNLRTAVFDSRRVTTVLQEKYGFHVRLIENGTRREILIALDEMRSRLQEDDNLLIYYAGHGYYDEQADRGYWLPVEAERHITANWISNADITDKLKAIKARHIIVVADSCYSGALTRGVNIRIPEPEYFKRIARKRSRTVMTSGGNEPVYDGGGAGTRSLPKRSSQPWKKTRA